MPLRPVRIESVVPDNWPTALRILFARFPEDEQEPRQAATLDAVAAGRLSLDGLRWAIQDGLPVGASLVMEQPDGISMVWPPIVTCAARDPDAVERLLLSEAERQLDESDAKLGQMLLDPDEIADLSAYRAAGFIKETELYFVARSLEEPLPDWSPAPWAAQTYDDGTSNRFAAAVTETYRHSLDCDVLDGLRTGDEALASHRLSGEWDPQWWRVFSIDHRDAAVLLINDHPEQDSVELVYFGVLPEFRGRGLGRALVRQALCDTAERGRSVLFGAVDAKNTYANRIYAEAGFVELAHRTALFRPPRRMARK